MLFGLFDKPKHKDENEERFDTVNQKTVDLRNQMREKTNRLNELLEQLGDKDGHKSSNGSR